MTKNSSHESGSGLNVQCLSRSRLIHGLPPLGVHYPKRSVPSFCVDGNFCSLGDPRNLVTTSLVGGLEVCKALS